MREGPADTRNILVLGASGLIGRFVTDDLRARGFNVTGIARRFAPGQADASSDHELPILSSPTPHIVAWLRDWRIDLVVNCLGVLQDGPGADTQAVHRDFVERLLSALRDSGRPVRLVHVSIPGDDGDDQTAFSRTKREAERMIAASGVRYAILRPGFVVAPAAYGGSALLRALAACPFDLPPAVAGTSFQSVAVEDIAATIAWLAQAPPPDNGGVVWDLMHPHQQTLGDVVAEFRRALGAAGRRTIRIPGLLLDAGAKLGDLAGLLGWSPPVRSTALAELRRGVRGDPSGWMAATGIMPRSLRDSIGRGGASIQDKWFAGLYLLKALIIVSLGVFWILSGAIALFVSTSAAAMVLASHQFPASLVAPFLIGSSLTDILVGVMIMIRRTSAIGLMVGIGVSLGYLAGAALLAPDVWLDPLGALVKVVPIIVLMLVALLTLDNR
ncbi:MAG: SDR family oxidoreductase [Pseudomonadota bacterium]